jgi:hypothetical protein
VTGRKKFFPVFDRKQNRKEPEGTGKKKNFFPVKKPERIPILP